jgi:hypothetical protein
MAHDRIVRRKRMTNLPDMNQLQLPDFSTPTDSDSTALPDFTPAPAETIGPAPAPGIFQRMTSALTGRPYGSPLYNLGRSLQEAPAVNEALSKPIIKLPRFTVNPDDSPPLAAGKAAANLLISLPEFATSLTGAAGILTGAAAPKTVAGLFAADTLHNLGSQVLDIHKNFLTQTPAQQAESIVNLVGTGALAGLLTHGAAKGLPDFGKTPETPPTPEPQPAPEPPPVRPVVDQSNDMLADHRASLDRVTAAVSNPEKQIISGRDARLSGTAERLPALGYAYDEAGDIFHPVRKLENNLNANQVKDTLGYGKSYPNENELQAGTQTVAGDTGKNETGGTAENGRPELAASINWLQNVARNDQKKVSDAEAELLGSPMGGQQIAQLKILVGIDPSGSSLRTSGDYGENVRQAAAKLRVRASQEPQWFGQQIGEFGTDPKNPAQQNAQPGIVDKEASGEDAGKSQTEAGAVVPQIQQVREVSNPQIQIRGKGVVQQLLGDNETEKKVSSVQAKASPNPIVTTPAAKFIGRQDDFSGKTTGWNMYNLQQDIMDSSGKILHSKGSTVSENTLNKYGVPFEPPVAKTLEPPYILEGVKPPEAPATPVVTPLVLEPYLQSLNLSPMQRGKLKTVLSQQVAKRGGGKIYSGDRSKVVSDMLADGYEPKTEQVKALKDLTGTQSNRMDNRQQQDFEKRQKAAGMKTEYRLEKGDGDSIFEVTKAEYDYAKWLKEKSSQPIQPEVAPSRLVPEGINIPQAQWDDMATLNDYEQQAKYGTSRAKEFEKAMLSKYSKPSALVPKKVSALTGGKLPKSEGSIPKPVEPAPKTRGGVTLSQNYEDENQSNAPAKVSDNVSDVRAVGSLISGLLAGHSRLSDVQKESIRNIKPVEAPAIHGVSGLETTSEAWRAIAKSFNQHIIFIDAGDNPLNIDGATVDGVPNTLFLNARSNKTFSSLIGHELLHNIQNEAQPLYDELVGKLAGLAKRGELQDFLNQRETLAAKSGVFINLKSEEEELVAQLFERSFDDPAFWNKLAQKDPPFFQKLATTVLDFLNRLIGRLKDNGAYKYFTDIDAAHDAIADTLQKFRQEHGIEKQTDSPEFKQWFADSKVINESGNPKVVYHGGVEPITEFDETKSKSYYPKQYMDMPHYVEGVSYFSDRPEVAESYAGTGYMRTASEYPKSVPGKNLLSEGYSVKAFYWDKARKKQTVKDVTNLAALPPEFLTPSGKPKRGVQLQVMNKRGTTVYFNTEDQPTPTIQQAVERAVQNYSRTKSGVYGEGANVMPVFLSLKNPFVMDAGGKTFHQINIGRVIRQAKADGYDGVIVHNVHDVAADPDLHEPSTTYAAFNPSQIKSAIGNIGAFDSKKSDVTLSQDLHENPESDTGKGDWVETIVMGHKTNVAGKEGTYSPESTDASIKYAKSIFDRLNIPVESETRPDPRRNNKPITFWRFSDFGKADLDGEKLVSEIRKEITESQGGGKPPDQLASLLNSVRINFEEGTLPFSEPIQQQLFNLSQGYYSWHAAILGAASQHSPDLLGVMRNVNVWLGRARYDAFGGDAFDTFFGRILQNFRNFFTPEEIEGAQKDFPALKEMMGRIMAQNLRDYSGKVFRKVQNQWKEKFAPKRSQLAQDARINEAAQSIIEQAKSKFGIKPQPSKRRDLSPYEKLLELVNAKNADKVGKLMEGAVSDAEYNAGLRAMTDAAKTEPDAKEKQALIDHLQLMAADQTVMPLPEYVEKGMNLPEYANWKVVRDNWFDYSPITNKLVEKVVQGDFKGTRFARENPDAKPVDTRIDLNKLAKSPETEVQRLLDAYYDNYEQAMGGAGASDGVKANVRRQIQEKVAQQLEQARQRARDPMFAEPRKAGEKLTPEQQIAQQLNAGLFKDVRLDIPDMVDQVASKSKITNLMPKIGDVVKQILNTPAFRQSDIEENFVNHLIEKLGIPADQAQAAWKVFSKAFESRMADARQKALETARKNLTPREQVVFRGNNVFWQKVERAVNAGLLDSSALLADVAKEHGWILPTDAQTKLIKSLVDKEQQLRTLPKQQESQIRLSHPDAKPEEVAAMIEKARREQEAATYEQRSEYIRRLGVEWTRMTRPINLTPWKYFSSKFRRNNAQALNEYETLDMLMKAGFGIFRLPTHITTQLLLHTPTRAIGRALTLRDNDILRGVKRGKVDVRFWQDVHGALSDSVKATLASIKPAILSARAEIMGRGESRNIDRLMSGINALERLSAMARREAEAGRWWNSAILHFINLPRVVQWYVSAVDHFQGKPTEYQEIMHQIEIRMREDGKSRAQINVAKDEVFKSMQSEFVQAVADTRVMFDHLGIEASDRQIEESAQNLVRRRVFDKMQQLGLPADAFEQDINILKSTVAWQEQTNRGVGGAVAGALRGVASLGESIGIPTSITRLSNAIGTGINYSLMNTPLYKLANVKVAGSTAEESPWFRTALDRNHRMVQAIVGTTLGTVAGALALSGLSTVQMMGPKDKKERDLWIAQGHKPGTIEFNLPDGSFIPVSMTVGPASLMAPYFSTFGAIHDLYSSRQKAQMKLNAEAKAKGIEPGKIAPVSSLDAMAVAGQALMGSIMSSRTASGLTSSAMENGVPNAQKLIASFVSPLIPALPAYQEISRMMGVQMDPKTASVWDFLVPLPTSPHRSVNVLGEPVETPDDVQRIIQVITAGSYPLPVNPADQKSQLGYSALFNSGYTPPSINPAKGYDISGTYRPLTDSELQQYTISRGQNLMSALSALGPNPTKQRVQQAYQQANAQALQGVGVALAHSTTKSAPAKIMAQHGVKHNAPRRHVLLPRLAHAGHHAASGLHTRHASLLRTRSHHASLLA